MSNPNIAAVSNIFGNLGQVALANTSANQLASNAVSSSTVLKIETVMVTNTTTSAVTVTLNTYSAAALGGTAYPLSTASIPANSQVALIDKTTSFYLTENTSLGATASVANAITVTSAWEVMS
jgi:hypothetical protein